MKVVKITISTPIYEVIGVLIGLWIGYCIFFWATVGRCSRGEYIITFFITGFYAVFIEGWAPVYNILSVVSLFVILFWIAACIRRFHDMDLSGWYALLLIVPLINILVVIYLLLKRGEFIGELFEKLRRMTPQEKIDFWTSFGLGIIFATPTFLVRPNEDLPKEIEFRREIYYDGLNKDKLMEAIRDIYRCLLYFHLKLNEQFRGQPKIETSMFG